MYRAGYICTTWLMWVAVSLCTCTQVPAHFILITWHVYIDNVIVECRNHCTVIAWRAFSVHVQKQTTLIIQIAKNHNQQLDTSTRLFAIIGKSTTHQQRYSSSFLLLLHMLIFIFMLLPKICNIILYMNLATTVHLDFYISMPNENCSWQFHRGRKCGASWLSGSRQ